MVIKEHIVLMCFFLENEQKKAGILIKTIILSLNCHITTPKKKKWSTQKWIDRFFRSHLVLVGYTASFCFLYYSTYIAFYNFSSFSFQSSHLDISEHLIFLIMQFSVFRIVSRGLKRFLIIPEQSLFLSSVLSNEICSVDFLVQCT